MARVHLSISSIAMLIFPLGSSDAAVQATQGDGKDSSLFPENVATTVRAIAQGKPIEPSPEALQALIAELESDVRNIEFRLQFLYFERKSALESLANAKRQSECFKK